MEVLNSNTTPYTSSVKKEQYGILHLGQEKLVRYQVDQNQTDGVQECHTLELPSSSSKAPIWLVDCAEHALWVLEHPTEWYNADYTSPRHSLKPEDCAIAKVIQSMQIRTEVCSIPSAIGFFEQKHRDNPKHLAEIIPHIKSGRLHYDLLDLSNYLQQERGINSESILYCRPAE